MNIILEKDGERIEYGTDKALYLLLSFIPYAGSLVVLVMSIMRKQFRGYWLNSFIIGLIFMTSIIILLLLGLVADLFIALAIIDVIGFLIFAIYMYVMYLLNANYYSIKQRLDEGYHVVNDGEAGVQAAIGKAQAIKKPFWQITKF